ncbi:FAD-binding oxidoreductase [Sphingosinicella sp. YJ22]|uniref:NAD(P)/FAD-dependent oxidoreductase n=1 Tax=Sphingosinicella sp. YJ22 TaxID=1104780 RepID=UPI00140AB3C4|nr:FAD-binding oxidoreductase [Sphingosinicella sp. YJ22]
MSTAFDVAIVGAGMAGASLAAEVAPHARVLLLEAEDHPGYHSTGRSAAFWSETYGGPGIQPLTTASREFLANPPEHVSDRSFLSHRGCLHIADASGEVALDRLLADFDGSDVVLEPRDRAELEAALPQVRPGWDRGVYEPSCADIDVAGLHAAYLRVARRAGAELVTDARVERAERAAGQWRLETRAGTFAAAVLVDAAGAWADEVAALAGERPLGIQPYRRTLLQVEVDPPAPGDLPLVVDAAERFYFKPEAGGRLWLSPHDETACDPCDCAPEELDVARAIAGLELATDWRVVRVERRWAGLRSFAPDRLPVYGFSDSGRGFFWCAGQGGFGIQTAPAAARLAAGLLLGRADMSAPDIEPSRYRPDRFAS